MAPPACIYGTHAKAASVRDNIPIGDCRESESASTAESSESSWIRNSYRNNALWDPDASFEYL